MRLGAGDMVGCCGMMMLINVTYKCGGDVGVIDVSTIVAVNMSIVNMWQVLATNVNHSIIKYEYKGRWTCMYDRSSHKEEPWFKCFPRVPQMRELFYRGLSLIGTWHSRNFLEPDVGHGRKFPQNFKFVHPLVGHRPVDGMPMLVNEAGFTLVIWEIYDYSQLFSWWSELCFRFFFTRWGNFFMFVNEPFRRFLIIQF